MHPTVRTLLTIAAAPCLAFGVDIQPAAAQSSAVIRGCVDAAGTLRVLAKASAPAAATKPRSAGMSRVRKASRAYPARTA